MNILKNIRYRRKILARGLDFVPILGPVFMLIGYALGRDLVSKVDFKRISRRGFSFMFSGILSLVAQVLLYRELLALVRHENIPVPVGENAVLIVITGIGTYICYAMFLGIDLFQSTEKRLAKKSYWVRKLKNQQEKQK